jgi:hypothetical protein
MRAVCRLLVLAWLLAALALLAMDHRLDDLLLWTVPGSLVVVVAGALLPHQLAPSRYNRPSLPERYRVADDLAEPLAVVVAVAEAEARQR